MEDFLLVLNEHGFEQGDRKPTAVERAREAKALREKKEAEAYEAL